MSDTREMLTKQVQGTRESIELFVRALEDDRDAIAELAENFAGVPVDEFDVHDTLVEWPLEVVDERGKEFAVVLSTGGPHIEVVADGGNSARLAGYWGGEQVYMHGDVFDTFLDYFIERD